MKKSTIATTGSITLAGLALMAAVTHADSNNYNDVANLQLDMEEAAIAASALGAGDIVEIELETDDAKPIWEIDIVDSQNKMVTLEIDGRTGDILTTKTDNDDELEFTPSDAINLAKAIDIVKAVEQGAIVEAELENENGNLIWELESISDANQERKYRVDAQTGEILI